MVVAASPYLTYAPTPSVGKPLTEIAYCSCIRGRGCGLIAKFEEVTDWEYWISP